MNNPVAPAVHPYVDSATVADDKITLRVEVSDFSAAGGFVEISGEATQVGGAFAIIFAKAEVPAGPNGDGEDKGRTFVNVTADAIPPHGFRKGQDITVFVRVSRVWVTVLGEQPASDDRIPVPPNSDDGTWGAVKEGAQINNDSWPQRSGTS